jgi:hypothetical protein
VLKVLYSAQGADPWIVGQLENLALELKIQEDSAHAGNLELRDLRNYVASVLGETVPIWSAAIQPCRGCNAPMVFAQGPNGDIPLDARAPVFRLIEGPSPRAERAAGYHVSHFATCPKARQFSRGRRSA